MTRAQDRATQSPEQDLDAYFGGLAASLGFHAGAWAAEAPPGIVDAMAISRKHDAAIGCGQAYWGLRDTIAHVEAFRRESPALWEIAALVYTPHRWPEHVLTGMHRCGNHALDKSHTPSCGRHGTLAGLVGLSRRIEAETAHARILVVERRAAGIVAATKRRLHRAAQHEQAEREADRALSLLFAPLRREAEERLQGAIWAYGELRRRRGRKVVDGLRAVFG